jgi:hypothetical protein
MQAHFYKKLQYEIIRFSDCCKPGIKFSKMQNCCDTCIHSTFKRQLFVIYEIKIQIKQKLLFISA